MNLFIEIMGWTGAMCVLAAYILVTAGRISGQSALFQWMNVAGATGFVINSGAHGAIPSMVLNIIWVGIGIGALWKITRPPQQ